MAGPGTPLYPPPVRPPRRAARGFILVALAGGVLAVVLLVLTTWSQVLSGRALAQQARTHQRAVSDAQTVLRDWYRQHLADLDASPPAATGLPDPAMALAVLVDHAGLHTALSPLQVYGDVQCRRVAIWWPVPGSAAQVDAADGQVTALRPDEPYALVDGCAEEQLALARAQRRLSALAGLLERWFQALDQHGLAHAVQDDPRHRLDINHFAGMAAACPAAPDASSCAESFVAVADQPALRQLADADAAGLQSPWGAASPYEVGGVANGLAGLPFAVSLRVRTPWGTVLTAQAVQPGA